MVGCQGLGDGLGSRRSKDIQSGRLLNRQTEMMKE